MAYGRDYCSVNPFAISLPTISSVTNYLIEDDFLGYAETLFTNLLELVSNFMKIRIQDIPVAHPSKGPSIEKAKVM